MPEQELPVEAGGAIAAPTALQRVTGAVAVLGGLLALAVAILVTVSVTGRWLFAKPIDGDFEFVKMATAVAVFCYLPYAQARRGNIMVDTFTMRLPQVTQRRMDAFWDVVYAVAMAALAFALFTGTMESIRNGETTMQRQILLWPSIGLAATLCALLSVTAFLSARALLAGGRR
jgi:TRAP-type C4-dicarboxylate transport system permease small subunit